MNNPSFKKAYFAGGCFWCVEHDLRESLGVLEVVSGYTGKIGNPTYENHKGFREAVEVVYDSEKTNFKQLCKFFIDHIDPTDGGGQFFDRGESYKTAIYFQNQEEKEIAESVIGELKESKIYFEAILLEILPRENFYKAEEYHQNYAVKNPDHYYAYRNGSGRGEFQAKTCVVRDQKKVFWKD